MRFGKLLLLVQRAWKTLWRYTVLSIPPGIWSTLKAPGLCRVRCRYGTVHLSGEKRKRKKRQGSPGGSCCPTEGLRFYQEGAGYGVISVEITLRAPALRHLCSLRIMMVSGHKLCRLGKFRYVERLGIQMVYHTTVAHSGTKKYLSTPAWLDLEEDVPNYPLSIYLNSSPFLKSLEWVANGLLGYGTTCDFAGIRVCRNYRHLGSRKELQKNSLCSPILSSLKFYNDCLFSPGKLAKQKPIPEWTSATPPPPRYHSFVQYARLFTRPFGTVTAPQKSNIPVDTP